MKQKENRINNFPKMFIAVVFLFLFSFSYADALTVLIGCPATQSSVFDKANELYKQGKYDSAIQEYGTIEKTGFESGNLYYNLGNCFFKKGQLGMAILYYEKALKLIPRDSDLKSNYELAKSRILSYAVPLKQHAAVKLAAVVSGELTIDELTFLVSFFYFFSLAIFLVRVFWPVSNTVLKLVFFTVLFLFVFSAFSLTEKIMSGSSDVIILKPKVQVRFEPFKKATVFFELAEGSKAEFLQKKGDWVKIRRCDGKTGWVTEGSIGFIHAPAMNTIS